MILLVQLIDLKYSYTRKNILKSFDEKEFIIHEELIISIEDCMIIC